MQKLSQTRFAEIFKQCAPTGAVLHISDNAASATVTASCGETLTACCPVDGQDRPVGGNAAGLADRCWEFMEAHDAYVRLRDLRAKARNLAFEIAALERKADCGFAVRYES